MVGVPCVFVVHDVHGNGIWHMLGGGGGFKFAGSTGF